MEILEVFQTGPARGWIERLRGRDPSPPLVPDRAWDSDLTREIQAASDAEFLPGVLPIDWDAASAIKCGLLLWNDALEPSHHLSQRIKNPTGSYWHGIMHRREPDFGNSKYWFARVGNHPAFVPLKERAIDHLRRRGDGYSQTWLGEIQTGGWSPEGFINRCEKALRGKEPPEVIELLEWVQVLEIENLLAWMGERGSARG